VIRLRADAVATVADDPVARRTHELATLHRLGADLARALDVGEVLERSLRAMVDMGWYACGEAYEVGRGAPRLVAVGSCPYDDLDACPLRPSLAEAVAEADPSIGPRLAHGWWTIPIERRAVLALKAREEVVDVSDAFLRSVVELIASALRRAALHARLAEKERQRARLLSALLTAQEEERGRISRDLHDQIGQALTGLLLGLDASIERPDPKELARLKELTSATLADVRRIALDLRPSVLDELGLEAAVRRFARDLHERHGLAVQVAIHLPRLAGQVETVLYRVVQEALTNVVRHARAASVSVVATVSPRQVQLVVEDDGAGFDPDALAPADQVGLVGMQERLELLGGSLNVESAPGAGTTLYARIPRRPG
jgi:signal transduction histidine kinase